MTVALKKPREARVTKVGTVCAAPNCPNLRPCPAHPVTPRLMGRHRQAQRAATIQQHGRYCQACGRGPLRNSDIHIDHRQALAAGGPEAPTNLQVLCRACNLGKGAS